MSLQIIALCVPYSLSSIHGYALTLAHQAELTGFHYERKRGVLSVIGGPVPVRLLLDGFK